MKGQENIPENMPTLIADAREWVSEYDLERLEPRSWPLVMRDLADAVEKMRPVFEFVQGLNGNIDEICEFINERDALRAALERARSVAVRLEQENAALTVGAARRVL